MFSVELDLFYVLVLLWSVIVPEQHCFSFDYIRKGLKYLFLWCGNVFDNFFT